MKKKIVVPILIMILLLTLACGISMDGIQFGEDEPALDPWLLTHHLETEAAEEGQYGSGPAVVPQEPEDKPVIPQSSNNANPESVNAGAQEYSVEATNFNCICSVDGNITPTFDFQDDHLIFNNDQVYGKVGENTYKRDWMGYYILSFPDEPGREDEKVDEERATVIKFNSNGYIMEHYSEASSSPCCYYTNTIIK